MQYCVTVDIGLRVEHKVGMHLITISLLWINLLSSIEIVVASSEDDSRVRQERDLFKGFSGYRLFNNSFRMVYYHDLTIAVVEIGDGMNLLNCELIEVFFDEQRKQTLQNLTKLVSRPLQLSFDDMMELMSQCDNLDSKIINRMIMNLLPKHEVSHRDSIPSTQSTLLSGIFPGTKWCGTGDIARTYFDLGVERNMDKCCRKHDLCPIKVKSNSLRYNLTNKSLYTKSHCVCDDEFLRCLRQVGKPAAEFMGKIYFNIIQVPCIEDTKNGKQFRSSKIF
ncbi:hypothetical protein PGB90_004009 [Kerria lacca]